MVTGSQVLGYVEKTFVKKLVSAINKEIKTIRERRFVHVHHIIDMRSLLM